MRSMREVQQYVQSLAQQQTYCESYSTLTSPLSLLDKQPLQLVGQPPEWIDILFGRFGLIFGKKWTESLTSEAMLGASKQEWVRWANAKYGADCLNKEVINLAIDLAADASPWPPAMKEFGEHIAAALDKIRRAMPALPPSEEDLAAIAAREDEAWRYSLEYRDILTRKYIELGNYPLARQQAEIEHSAILNELKQAKKEARKFDLKTLIIEVRERLASQVLKNGFCAAA